MANRTNSIGVIDGVVCYATLYGKEAFAYAIIDMIKNDNIHLTSKQTELLWSYLGDKGKD